MVLHADLPVPPLLTHLDLGHPIFVQLPKGPASNPSTKSLNPLARYKARYFDGKNASGAPLVHAIVGIFLIGYTIGASWLVALSLLQDQLGDLY